MIQEIKQKIKQRPELFIILSFLLLSILVITPVYLYSQQILIGDDYHFHQNRIEGLAQSIANGIWFPKVNHFFIGGYGYASSLFYPDFYLYIPALLRIIGLPLSATYIIFTILLNLATLVVTYLSGKIMDLSSKKSYLFSLLYTLSIYRLQDLINRQAIGEVIAITFLPLALAGMYELKNKINPRWWILTIAMTGIGLAHIISIEMMTLFIMLFMIFNWKKFASNKIFLNLIKAGTLTILLLSFFLFPILEQFIHSNFQVTTNPLVKLSDRSLEPLNLIKNSLTNAVFHASTGNIGIVLFVGLILYTAVLLKMRKKTENSDIIILSIFLFILTTTLFPWQLVNQTFLNTIQFPWRYLSFVSLLVSYLLANDQIGIFKKWKSSYYIMMGMTVFLALGYGTKVVLAQQNRVLSYEKYNQTNSYYIGAGHEYLPEQTNYDELRKYKNRPLVYSEKKIKISNQSQTFATYSFDYKVKGTDEVTVTVPFVYYYGYQATVEATKEKLPLTINPETGLVSVVLKGQGRVKIDYQLTLIQNIATTISLVSVVGCLWYLVKQRRK